MKATELLKKQELLRKQNKQKETNELIEFVGSQFQTLANRNLQIPVKAFSL